MQDGDWRVGNVHQGGQSGAAKAGGEKAVIYTLLLALLFHFHPVRNPAWVVTCHLCGDIHPQGSRR